MSLDELGRQRAARMFAHRNDRAAHVAARRNRIFNHDVLIACIALTGFLFSVALLYPGQYPFDSAYQLWQARTGQFSNLSPVTMSALWALLIKITGNPSSLLIANLGIFWIGSALHGLALKGSLWLRLIVTTLPGLWIPNLPQLAHLLSDTHLASVLMLASGAISFAMTRRRQLYLWIALTALIYAGSIRHNAILAILPLAILACWAYFTAGRSFKIRHVTYASLMLCATTFLFGAVLDRKLVVQRVTVWPTIALWDVAAVSIARGELLFPEFTHGEGLTVDELIDTKAFDVTSNTALFSNTKSGMRSGLEDAFNDDEIESLRSAWLAAVVDHPLAYLQHRLRTLQLLTSRRGDDNPSMAFYVNRTLYRDNPAFAEPLLHRAQRALYATADQLKSTWAFSAQPQLFAGLIAFVFASRKRDHPMRLLAMALSASGLLYAASFFLIAPSAELRYLTWPMIACPLALCVLLASRTQIPDAET